jgi:hypothetical protein
MRKLEWIHGNKARIETGHGEFDRQCTAVMTGNVIGGGQYSNHVRPRLETECNGRENQPGHLRDFDLQHFELPAHVRKAVVDATESECAILYRFSHYSYKKHEHVNHGYVLTRGHDRDHALIATFVTGPSAKSRAVIEWVKDFVSNPA